MEHEPNDITLETANGNFNYRAAGTIFDSTGRILVTTSTTAAAVLIGGRVKLHESAAAAITREFQEELGVSVTPIHLLAAADHQVTIPGETWQQIVLLFQVETTSTLPEATCNGDHLLWQTPERLAQIDFQPAELQPYLQPNRSPHYIQDLDAGFGSSW
ncbi:NUDIX domain-containing protein [Levilactobacillus fujinensis]|uniref:NUDIX domain-containing protein n=1 Tax=Levilactobacillus fujinensis TaxID=2486024 RepID=A0ABW1TIS6_9LACO|nr:NUDIX domain-containing protein [Levilactobacillus fujinensis]